jgi:hypothetical protein
MVMYALALVPLIRGVQSSCNQVWYADDATDCDTLEKLRSWFDSLQSEGPKYGYFPKPAKCILLVKPDLLEKALMVFTGTGVSLQTAGAKDSGVELITSGTRHLGAAVGTSHFKEHYVNAKIDNWILSLKQLCAIAASQPHAAFTVFTHCMQAQWTFLSRSTCGATHLFQRLEDVIRLDFLPALLHREVNDLESEILSLPARHGGLGIACPTVTAVDAHENSLKISEPLVKLILRQEKKIAFDPEDVLEEVKHIKMQIDDKSERLFKIKRNELMSQSSSLQWLLLLKKGPRAG